MPLGPPTPAQVVPGQFIAGALWNANVYSGLTFLKDRPLFIGQQQTGQSIANGTWAVVTFDTEIVDTYGGHSTVSNTSRYTCQMAGWYRVTGRTAFNGNPTGSRGARVHINGNYIIGAATLLGSGTLNGVPEVNHILQLAVGDYIEIGAGHNCGSALSTIYANECASMMYVEWIHS